MTGVDSRPAPPIPDGREIPAPARGAGRIIAATPAWGWRDRLEQVARSEHDQVSVADLEAVLATAGAAAAQRWPDHDPDILTRRLAAAVAATRRLTTTTSGPANWAGFGVVVPVLAGSPGAGASVLAAALVDALQHRGKLCALLVDASDPARSGLAMAADVDGPWVQQPHPDIAIRYSWREAALLARVESTLPAVTPGMIPPPRSWLPELEPLHATVVDLGHDGWRAAADPRSGVGGWLRRGLPATRPLLVVRATRPSLRHAEQVLARLAPWIDLGEVEPPAQLVVMAARRWPRGVVGAAGRLLTPLLDTARFVAHDREVERGGVSGDPLPARLLSAAVPVLQTCGLLTPPDPTRPWETR